MSSSSNQSEPSLLKSAWRERERGREGVADMRTAFRVESSETCAANGAIVVASWHQFVVLEMERWSLMN